MMMKNKKNVPDIRFREFGGNWESRRFDKTFSTLSNNTLSRANLNYEKGSIKNVHYGDILIKFGECADVSCEDIPYISDEKIVAKYLASRLQDGDIVFADTAEDATAGKCTEFFNIKGESIISGLHTIPCHPLLPFSIGYLGYFLNSPAYHNQLLSLMQGTKVVGISKSAIKETNVSFPENTHEQQAIGNYFQNIDRLINTSQTKLDKLKNIKKACLEKMFPRNGSTTPELRLKGFTDEWTPEILRELSEPLEYGLNAPSTAYDGINKYIRITDIEDDTRLLNRKGLTSPNVDLGLYPSYQLKFGDVLFARTGASVGKSYLYRNTDGLVYYAGFLIRARIKSNIDPEFVFQNTLTSKYYKFIKITSQRSGQPGINAQEYSSWSLMLPKSADEQKAIGKFFNCLDRLVIITEQQINKLKNIKKVCLDKMFVNTEDKI